MGSRLEKKSELVRKRIEAHTFQDEEGEEYEGSKFGGFSDYFRRKKLKLQNLDAEVRSSSAGHPQIFRGVVAHVNGYTQPSLNDLHHLIVRHGGGFMQYLDGKTSVTHIIAANLTPKKAVEFKRYRIVKPAWVVESVKAGKLLPWDSFRVLDEGSGQRLLGFNDGKVVSHVNVQQRGYREQTNTSWYTSQVRHVADGIDDVEGAHFPSTQPAALNGTEASLTGSLAGQPENPFGTTILKSNEMNAKPSSSENFDVSSSLEDALAIVEVRDFLTEPTPLQDETGMEPPGYQDLPPGITHESEVESFLNDDNGHPDGKTTPKFDHSPNALKRPNEVETPSPSKKARIMTAEEHNALLLADPRIRKSSTANPEFMKQFYSESRLHHLSTWKSDLKSKFQQMATERLATQSRPMKRKPGSRQYIMHVDFDSFFCSVSLKSAPEYIDKPAVVAHGTGTGSEIASCNYAARAFGIKNGMWMRSALQLCADIKVLPYDFPAYEEASRGFYETILDVGGIVQSVSVDEALVDITSLCLSQAGTDGLGTHEENIAREQGAADKLARNLRERIKEKTGCSVSVGIGGNILLAKVALRKAKPAGQHQIKPQEVLDFIGELSVRDLPGVAYSIGGKLDEMGVKLVKDIRQLSKERLITALGPKTGEKLWEYSKGIDRTQVGDQVVRKSVSAEINWGIRFISQPEAEEFVQNLCVELSRRLLEQMVRGRQLTMKIMRKSADAPLDPPKHLGHGLCDSFNKSVLLGVATNNAEVLGREAIMILRSYGFSPGELRGLGVQMTKLEPLKAPTNAQPDGSQMRIDFGTFTMQKVAKQITKDAIDDPQTPKKARPPRNDLGRYSLISPEDPIDDSVTPEKLKTVAARLMDNEDPIDDNISPRKPKDTPVHPAAAIARANAADKSATKLLNLTGTQFIIPSQIDPAVLAELPQDIRSKFVAQRKPRANSQGQSSAASSRSQSPSGRASVQLPPHLDPEVFSALPEDMKVEILASYQPQAAGSRGFNAMSPRKPRPTKKPVTPTKKRSLLFRSRNSKQDTYSTLTQSNFVAPKRNDSLGKDSQQNPDSDGYTSDPLDADFLSALPPDMRAEVIGEHRRKRLAKHGGLMTSINSGISTAAKKRRAAANAGEGAAQTGQRKLRLPTREARPTFTSQGLNTLAQLRETVSAWYKEFEGEGPHAEDVDAMQRYLRRVVVEERDLAKVVGVVRWISWVVDGDWGGGWVLGDAGDCDDHRGAKGSGNGMREGQGKRLWMQALEDIKEKVQMAVKERGLGSLEF